MTDEHGTPIKKGWTISSDVEEFAALEQLRCDGQHEHAQSRGKALTEAEGYTFRLTDRIHTMFKNLGQRDLVNLCTEVQTVHAACATYAHTHTHSNSHTHTHITHHSTSQTKDTQLRCTADCPGRSLFGEHPLPGCPAMEQIDDINEDDLLQIDWDNHSTEPIERYLSVNYFPETEERWTKFLAYAVYQAMMLSEEGSKEHHEQLAELLRTIHPITLYDIWLKDCIFTDAMRGLTTIHPTMYGHLNALAETQRPKAAIVVTDSILCFLNGKRSKTAYEPVDEIKLAFGKDWSDVEVRIIWGPWGADLPRLLREYNDDAGARIKARAQLKMCNPEQDSPRIYGLIWWNGNDLVGRNGICDFQSSWRHECANPDRLGTEARILATFEDWNNASSIQKSLFGISSYIFELPSFVDECWTKVFDVIDELGIPRFQPDTIVYNADRVDQWHLRKT